MRAARVATGAKAGTAVGAAAARRAALHEVRKSRAAAVEACIKAAASYRETQRSTASYALCKRALANETRRAATAFAAVASGKAKSTRCVLAAERRAALLSSRVARAKLSTMLRAAAVKLTTAVPEGRTVAVVSVLIAPATVKSADPTPSDGVLVTAADAEAPVVCAATTAPGLVRRLVDRVFARVGF